MVKNVLRAEKVALFGVSKPRYLWLEVSTVCNSRCVTCNIWRNKTNASFNFGVLKSPLFRDVEYVINSGGEPSLIDLKSALMIEHSLLPNAVLQVSTNGLLPEKVLDAVHAVLQAGAKVDVGISLDGVGEHHDKVRGVPGNFKKVEVLVDWLRALRVHYPDRLKVVVGSTLTEETFKHKDELVAFAKRKGVEFMYHWYNSSKFYENTPSLNECRNLKDALSCMPDSLYKEMWLANKPCFECYALRSFLVLKANGDVVPCLSKWDCSVGNFNYQSMENIWRNMDDKLAVIKACKGCLNSWGVGWSLNTSYFENLDYKISKKLRLN